MGRRTLSQHLPGGPQTRDWNEELQTTRELPRKNLPERLLRERAIFKVPGPRSLPPLAYSPGLGEKRDLPPPGPRAAVQPALLSADCMEPSLGHMLPALTLIVLAVSLVLKLSVLWLEKEMRKI